MSCVKGNIKDEALVEINLKVQEFILFFSAYLSFICVSLSVLAEMFILNKLMLSQIVSYVYVDYLLKIKKVSLIEQYNYGQE